MHKFSRLALSSLAIAAGLFAAGAEGLRAAETIGGATAVEPAANRTPDGGTQGTLSQGDAIALMDTIMTDAVGKAALLFNDESTLVVGPESEVVIDEFVYSGGGGGSFGLNISQGVASYAGGHISKQENVTFTTPQGTIGIRGGMLVIEVIDGKTMGAQLFGTMTCSWEGAQEVITKAGFGCQITKDGIEVIPIPPELLEKIFAALTGEDDGSGGDDVTSLLDLFCDSGFATNHKDCDAPPGGLAGTQPEDLDPTKDPDEDGDPDGNPQDLGQTICDAFPNDPSLCD